MPYPTPHRRLRRLTLGLTAGTLTLTGLALASGPTATAAVQVELTPVHVDTSATRATGHNDFLADGVRVWTQGSTSTDKAAGYFDVNLPLAGVGEPSMDWSNNLPAQNYRPGMQLKTDFNGDGDVDGILVGEPVLADGTTFLGNRWWLAGGADRKADVESPGVTLPVDGTQPSYRQNLASLDDWRALFPNARVLQAGWSLGSGALGDGTIFGMTVGNTDYLFSNDEASATKKLYPSDVDTTQTRATGHNDFRPTSGVRVWTEGSTSTDKAAGYFPVGERLGAVGEPTLAWRNNGASTARPGLQLVVDIDADGTADGILVGEPVYKDIAASVNWWLSGGSATQAFKDLAPSDDAGNGSSWNGTLAEWRAVLPAHAQVLASGWSLGSGVKGDGVVESIKVGRTTYTFSGKNRAAAALPVSASAPAGTSVVVTLPATDADGDTLTYTAPRGTVAGNRLTVAVPADAAGAYPVAYTADDGRGGQAQGTVTINVTKARATATLTIKPVVVTTAKTVRIVVRVASSGATQNGAVVIRDNGRVVGRGKVAQGKATIVLARKLAVGTHRFKAAYAGTSFTLPATAKGSVRVLR
ncbi:Ig-like domain repeat protein [Pimelobacter simplex]|uniref:Ig-like domain repeat protein n=1 Tax=Nocardioides simplex TaxID=2045 RepID=UPI003AAB4FE2